MSILNDKLERIIADSGINFYKEEIGNELKAAVKLFDYVEAINKMWDALPGDANIAIYGLGMNSDYLFYSVDISKKKVVALIDNNPDITVSMGYSVIRSKDIAANKIDIFIVTSRKYAEEIIADIKAVSPDSKIINIWEDFSSTNYGYSNAWLMYSKGILFNRFSLNAAVLLFKENRDLKYLLYIIGCYLEHRDFKNSFVYIDMYFSSDYPDKDKVLNLKTGLLNLLDEIKQKLKAKQNPHTLVFISDSMDSVDITPEQTPFLDALGKSNIQCTNAYSHMSWTTTSLLTIFKQRSFLDNHLYKDLFLTGSEPLLSNLKKNKIDFAYYAPFYKDLFKNLPEVLNIIENGSADTIWQYLCTAFESDKKSLFFLHFLETHVPFLCLKHSGKINPFDNINYSDCVKYIDSQTEFLFDLLPCSTKFLFCSDHGLVQSISINSLPFFKKSVKSCNIPYIIYDGKTHGGKDERLVSHLDTAEILINLLNDRPAFENIGSRKFVELNQEFLYSEHIIKRYIKLKDFSACKCFVTEYDKYLVFSDGEERYFLLSDISKNLIDDEAYADRINWFRENVNTEFPDWNDDNGRYDITRRYYDMEKKVLK